MNAACAALEQAALIRKVGGRLGESSGRQRNDYVVNPLLF